MTTLRDLLARHVHAEDADAILAALVADPETVEVLAAALGRQSGCKPGCGSCHVEAAATLRELTGEPE